MPIEHANSIPDQNTFPLKIWAPEFVSFSLRHPLGGWRYITRSGVVAAVLCELFKATPKDLKKLEDEFIGSVGYAAIMQSMSDLLRSVDPLGSMALYMVCRLSKPAVVVETGVASGVSSTAILQALKDNDSGELHSVSLPEQASTSVDKDAVGERELGWIIPTQLKEKWRLHRGSSLEVLPSLLDELRPIDVFFHDSDHSFENVAFELKEAIPSLRSGGAIIVDDVNFPYVRRAFSNACNGIQVKPWYIPRLFPPPEEMGLARSIRVVSKDIFEVPS